jgi:CPA1 family monovalent cation:H+ antiporter
MVTFELILSLLLVGVLLAAVARRVKMPYPVLLAGLGAALAFVPGLPELTLDPALMLALFVAPVLLDAAYDASLRDLRDNWRPVAGLTLVAVGLTVVSVAVVVRWLVPGMPWPAAVALGAIVAPPDASAAAAILRQLRPPHRVLVILEGESLFNDATALLIYRAAVGFTGAGTMWGKVPALALTTMGSVVAGLLLGRLYVHFFGRLQDVGTAILTQFLGVFLVWIFAERIGLSGIITMVCYAIAIAQISPARTPARLRIPSYAVWEVVVFTLNLLVFILVGFQLKPLLHRLYETGEARYVTVGMAVCTTAMIVRIAWVMAYNSVVRWKNHRFGVRLPRPMMLPSFRSGVIISWCGMRGIVTLAAALALPDGSDGRPAFPYRDLILFSAFCVVLGTLLIQGLTLRPLMLALGLRDDGAVEREVAVARSVTARAALQALEGERQSKATEVVRLGYEARLAPADPSLPATDGQNAATELVWVQRRAIAAERDALVGLRARGEIGDDAFHRIEEELDWAEVHTLRDG